jgi:HTH-type transcriptional regulator, sugar sensing transcriptional regulator
VEFLKIHRHDLRQVTGVPYSGELGHPFQVVDDDTVVLALTIHSSKKADLRHCSFAIASSPSLSDRFNERWRKAMKSPREIQDDPRGHQS